MSERPSSNTGGVPTFAIGGRMVHVRERLIGMTEEERRWRAQFLKDQILDEDEPKITPEYERATANIFRRAVRFPMKMLQNVLTPVVGPKKAARIRYNTGRSIVTSLVFLILLYKMKFNQMDWTMSRGLSVFYLPRPLLPGDPGYHNPYVPKKHEYADYGFSESHFYKG